MLKVRDTFAKGSSETSTDTAVGARQQSSALQENHDLDCSGHFREHKNRWVIFLEQEWATSVSIKEFRSVLKSELLRTKKFFCGIIRVLADRAG